MTNNFESNNQSFSLSGEELDLRIIFNFFGRNKIFIGSISSIFFVLFCLYSFTLKKVWQGQFQIVLNKDTPANQVDIDPNIKRFVGLNKKNDLDTQVAILESPSILMPIFEFVQDTKQKKGSNFKDTYGNWKKKNLDIGLQKNTSVLNIAYRDVDKKLIISLLNKMTFAYQEYSGRNKKRAQELTKEYLKNQINLFKEKSAKSLKIVQNFSIEQDLYSPDFQKPLDDSLLSVQSLLLPNIDIENTRVQAANRIRQIDIQLEKISELNDSEELQYIGSTIPALKGEGLPDILKSIEQELVEKRSIYTEEDINIINLIKRRNLIIKLLKDRTIKYLKASRLDVEAKMEAAMRPKGVILKYKELLREASRDETTLISLENQLRIIELEEAKTEDPWELITKPTLNDLPVAPSKKKIGFLGLLVGLFFGTIISFYKEKKSDNIFEWKILEQLLNTTVIEKFNFDEIIADSEKIIFLKTFLNLKKNNKLFALSLEDDVTGKVVKFLKIFNEANDSSIKINLISIKDLKNVGNSDNLFLIAGTNSLKYSQIDKLKDRLNLLNLVLEGIILYED